MVSVCQGDLRRPDPHPKPSIYDNFIILVCSFIKDDDFVRENVWRSLVFKFFVYCYGVCACVLCT